MRSSVGVTRWVRAEPAIGDARKAREAWLHRDYGTVWRMARGGDVTAQTLLGVTCNLLIERARQQRGKSPVVQLEHGWTVRFTNAHNDDVPAQEQTLLTSPDGTVIDPEDVAAWQSTDACSQDNVPPQAVPGVDPHV